MLQNKHLERHVKCIKLFNLTKTLYNFSRFSLIFVKLNIYFSKIFFKGNTMKFFLCVIGMVMIVEGLPYFAFPNKMKTWAQIIIEMPENSMRKIGVAFMAAGLLLVYFGTI